MTVRTRFAPSPTGHLHLGNARAALFNALYAASHAGTFILRVEDTDRDRSRIEFEDSLVEDLHWLGLRWNEGPDLGGPVGPYRQSERTDLYERSIKTLLAQQAAYPCFCSEQQLASERQKQLASGSPPRYSGRCARLSWQEANRRVSAGEPHTIRFRVPRQQEINYVDLVSGPTGVFSEDIGDFIIRRANGVPSFLFANAVDDAHMQVTHVLRGRDHVSNTPRQLLILSSLGLSAPAYGHLPLILGTDGKPLAKRTGSASVNGLRKSGLLPIAILNYLARLGHKLESSEVLDFGELARTFSLHNISTAPAHDDPSQLDHWQQLAVHQLNPEDAADWVGGVEFDTNSWALIWGLIGDNVRHREDVSGWLDVLSPHFALDPEVREEMAQSSEALFEAAMDLVDKSEFATVIEALRQATGLKGKSLYHPLRLALSGRSSGPELGRLWGYFSANERLRRLASALSYCQRR